MANYSELHYQNVTFINESTGNLTWEIRLDPNTSSAQVWDQNVNPFFSGNEELFK